MATTERGSWLGNVSPSSLLFLSLPHTSTPSRTPGAKGCILCIRGECAWLGRGEVFHATLGMRDMLQPGGRARGDVKGFIRGRGCTWVYAVLDLIYSPRLNCRQCFCKTLVLNRSKYAHREHTHLKIIEHHRPHRNVGSNNSIMLFTSCPYAPAQNPPT